MATDPSAQHYIECAECHRNAEYYCNTCADVRLCVTCKKKHESKHHEVVTYREKKKVELCNIHSAMPYIMCCQQCEVPVCWKCIDQNHRKHSLLRTDIIFRSKKEEYLRVKNEFLPQCRALFRDVQSDSKICKEKIIKIQSAMTSKAHTLKATIDTVLAENTEFLMVIENSLICELQQQEKVMNSHIEYLENIVDEYERFISNRQYAAFIKFQKDNPMSEVEENLKLTEINLPSFTDVKVNKQEIATLLGNISESTEPSVLRKVGNKHENKKSDTSLKPFSTAKQIPTTTKLISFTAPGILSSHHISPATTNSAWISDFSGNLILADMKGNKLNEIRFPHYKFGCHAMSGAGKIIFLNNDGGIYKFTANTMKLITKVTGSVSCIYSSPSNGDILVGTILPPTLIRYKKTGHEVSRLQYDNNGQPLYIGPQYITENQLNEDVCVSDLNQHAVVVIAHRNGNRCFTYKGHPPGSDFAPYGITTDRQGHILVVDAKSHTIQMTDKNCNFISFLLTKEQGLINPTGLTLDIKNNLLWVGEFYNSEVSIYRYNNTSETTLPVQ